MRYMKSFKRWTKEKLAQIAGNETVTLVVIPESTQQVHKVVIPASALKVGLLIASLVLVFFVYVGIDYANLMWNLSENQTLKTENLKLRTDMLEIRNKVEMMESTIERVRDYAKKLQVLTGQPQKGSRSMPWDDSEVLSEKEGEKQEGARKDQHSSAHAEGEPLSLQDLGIKIDQLKEYSLQTEANISKVHISLQEKQFLIRATPSLIPIRGRVSSVFGYRRNPVNNSFKLHAGVDLVARPGTPVVAPADGQVVFSGERAGYGKVVVLNHGFGIQTVFAHNSKLFAPLRAIVKRGDVIAQVGSTGHSTGPHLHYEVRKNGVPVDPRPFFSPLNKVSKG
ncbi:MAG: M23 family metallopeptidase [Proteobacteria bacterium]|nr:M23 family metallopeptidase [Pseudomonadota bacterium]